MLKPRFSHLSEQEQSLGRESRHGELADSLMLVFQHPVNAGSVLRKSWVDFKDKADVVLYLIRGWGHVWPGGYFTAALSRIFLHQFFHDDPCRPPQKNTRIFSSGQIHSRQKNQM